MCRSLFNTKMFLNFPKTLVTFIPDYFLQNKILIIFHQKTYTEPEKLNLNSMQFSDVCENNF